MPISPDANALKYLAETSSTNDAVLHLPALLQEDISGVYTFLQTQGRGQYGNVWQSGDGENIALSIAVKTACISVPQNFINFYTAALVREFVDKLAGMPTQIKWPNDIILKNKKTGGLLTELKNIGNERFAILGIGLNVNQKIFENLPKAASLYTQTGNFFELHDTARNLFLHIQNGYQNIPKPEEILAEYNFYLFKKNEVAAYKTGEILQNGKALFADEYGNLTVETERGGIQIFRPKEIEMLY